MQSQKLYFKSFFLSVDNWSEQMHVDVSDFNALFNSWKVNEFFEDSDNYIDHIELTVDETE